MYKRILVPLDGSHQAEQVLPYVCWMARSLSLPVELLRVFNPVSERLADPLHGRFLDAVTAGFRDAAMDYLNQVKRKMNGLPVPITCEAHEGRPASWIVDHADKEPGTIIAMSTHGRSGISRWLLGSVTDKVLRTSSSPLLVVRPPERGAPQANPEIKSIIAPLDGSELAEQSIPHLVALARGLDLKVVLVRVAPPEIDECTRYLIGVRKNLQLQGVASVESCLVKGHAAETILGMAHATNASLVAMTTHGRSGIGRWMMGSVTDRVVRHSGGPVLVILSSG